MSLCENASRFTKLATIATATLIFSLESQSLNVHEQNVPCLIDETRLEIDSKVICIEKKLRKPASPSIADDTCHMQLPERRLMTLQEIQEAIRLRVIQIPSTGEYAKNEFDYYLIKNAPYSMSQIINGMGDVGFRCVHDVNS